VAWASAAPTPRMCAAAIVVPSSATLATIAANDLRLMRVMLFFDLSGGIPGNRVRRSERRVDVLTGIRARNVSHLDDRGASRFGNSLDANGKIVGGLALNGA